MCNDVKCSGSLNIVNLLSPQDQKGQFYSDFSFVSFLLAFLVNFLFLLVNFLILFSALVNFLFGELPDFLLVDFYNPLSFLVACITLKVPTIFSSIC